MEDCSWDHLRVLTKDEIIEYLKLRLAYCAPLKEDVNYFKWYKTNTKLQKEEVAHLKKSEEIQELARKHDELAKECNDTKDIYEQLKLLDKMNELSLKITYHHKEWKKIKKKQDKNDKLVGL